MVDRRYQAIKRELVRVRRRKRRIRYWRPVAITAAACFILMRFVVGVSVVSGMSMAPSLLPGDVVFSQRLGAHPKNGSLIIIRDSLGDQIVKRVEGRQGDILEVTADGHLIRNGELIREPEVWYGSQDTSQWIDFPLTLPKGTLFCLGDNRPLSLDSRQRTIGPILYKDVEGCILFVLRGQH